MSAGRPSVEEVLAAVGVADVPDLRELIAQAIEADAEFEGVRAQRVIKRCAYIARNFERGES